MNTKRILIYGQLIALLFLQSFSYAQNSKSSIEIFEQAWKIMDTNYPNFNDNQIDWNALGEIYRTKVTNETSDEELFDILSRMIAHLNDSHISLSIDREKIHFSSGRVQEREKGDFDEALILEKYLNGAYHKFQNGNYLYGWLNKDLAYLRIRIWKQGEKAGAIADSILSKIGSAKGLIIDVRDNTGGSRLGANEIANRFADQKRLYLKEFAKRGAGHNSFHQPEYHYIHPDGTEQFLKPVVILQHIFSESATETFIQAMSVLPQVRTVGEATSGAFGLFYPNYLANGWRLSLASTYKMDHNNRSWIGSGLLPNYRITNNKKDIEEGNDKVLEFAVNLISTSSKLKNKNEGIFEEMPSSLYEIFKKYTAEKGVKEAIIECKRILNVSPESVYASIIEFKNGARYYLQNQKVDELIGVAEFGNEMWPDDIAFPWILGLVYSQTGDPEKALVAYKKATKLEAYFPWDKGFKNQAIEYVKQNTN